MGFAKVRVAVGKEREREREREREQGGCVARPPPTNTTRPPSSPPPRRPPPSPSPQLLPRGGRTYTLCGTPDYIAPEVVLNRGHGRGADWWSFGVLVYEMLAGYPPFYDADTAETYRKIVDGGFAVPPHFSAAAKDLVARLLTADLSRRLGCLAGGGGDVRGHPWFRGVDWGAVTERRGAAPITPRKGGGAGAGAGAGGGGAAVDALAAVNFDDYSALPPLESGEPLSKAEQTLFAGL